MVRSATLRSRSWEVDGSRDWVPVRTLWLLVLVHVLQIALGTLLTDAAFNPITGNCTSADRQRKQAGTEQLMTSFHPWTAPGCCTDLSVFTTPVGAGLLAKAVCQSTEMLNMPSSSRASPLPHNVAHSIGFKPAFR